MKPTLARLLLFLALILTACTPAPSPDTTPVPLHTPRLISTAPPQAATALPVTPGALKGVTIQVWHPWFGTDASLFESMVAEFNSRNQWGIRVVSTGQVSYSMLYDNVTAALPTDKRPNLIVALPEQARAWDADGYVVDLTPYVSDPVYGWTADEAKDFPGVFRQQDSDGERTLALPLQRSARFLLWNKSWAQELGYPKPPDTPDDFRRQACSATQKLTTDTIPDNNGMGGWLVDTEAMTALSWLQAFGGGALEENDYRFMRPENIAAFTFVRKLQEDGCAWMGGADSDPLAAFAQRRALFITAGLEQFPGVTRAFGAAGSRDEWVPLAFPGKTKDALVIYGSSLVMLKSSETAQLATWLFMDWLLSPDNDAREARATGLFPIRTSTMNLLGDYASSHPQWAAAVGLIPQGSIQPQLPSWRKVRVMLGDGFTEMFRVSLPSGQVPAILAQMESTSHDLSR